MVANSTIGLRFVAIWFMVPLALCAKSTLKVAVCNPGQVPYATVQDNGTLTGYDVGKVLICLYRLCALSLLVILSALMANVKPHCHSIIFKKSMPNCAGVRL